MTSTFYPNLGQLFFHFRKIPQMICSLLRHPGVYYHVISFDSLPIIVQNILNGVDNVYIRKNLELTNIHTTYSVVCTAVIGILR